MIGLAQRMITQLSAIAENTGNLQMNPYGEDAIAPRGWGTLLAIAAGIILLFALALFASGGNTWAKYGLAIYGIVFFTAGVLDNIRRRRVRKLGKDICMAVLHASSGKYRIDTLISAPKPGVWYRVSLQVDFSQRFEGKPNLSFLNIDLHKSA